MKYALIQQPAGLGDILFTLKIAFKINEKYKPEQIIWPICNEYIDIMKYIVVPDNLKFVREDSNFIGKEYYNRFTTTITQTEDFIHIPLQHSCEATYGFFNFQQNLYSKYSYVGLNYEGWNEYVKLNRDYKKEDELYNLKVTEEPYILVNRNYGTNPQGRQDINLPHNKHIIELNYTEGYNLFDWLKIIERADEVHTLQTSLAYLLDIIHKENVYIYHRTVKRSDILNTDQNSFEYCKKIHNPNWIFES
jgi:hypothetical protein